MQFIDNGYIVNIRKYGESSLILSIVSKEHGLISGFVKGGMSKKNLGIYQIGNKLTVDAYARIEENMLSFKTELLSATSVNFLSSAHKLSALSALCSLCLSCLPEKENIGHLFNTLDGFFKQIDKEDWIKNYAIFEYRLLDFLGIGLDLSECAASGTKENLMYVSPKSGRAVCENEGIPYKDRMFLYPKFIVDKNIIPTSLEVADLLQMTEFFLRKNFFQTHNLKFPPNRANLLANLGL